MVRLSVLIALTAILAAGPVHAQTDRPDVLNTLARAMAEGDVQAVLSHAGGRVDVGVFGVTRTYSRSQAGFVLKRFFEQNPPVSVALERATGTRDGWYASARYRAAHRAEPIRVYMRIRRERGSWQLRELVVREDPE